MKNKTIGNIVSDKEKGIACTELESKLIKMALKSNIATGNTSPLLDRIKKAFPVELAEALTELEK